MNTIYAHSHCVPCMKWTHVNKFGEVDPNIAINTLIAPFADAANLFLDTHLPLDDVLRDNILGADCVFFHFHFPLLYLQLENHDGHVDRGSSGKSHDTTHLGLRKGLSAQIPWGVWEGLRIEDLEDRLLPINIFQTYSFPLFFVGGSFKVGFCWGD